MNLLRLWRRPRWYRERAAELESYLEAESADNRARGLTPAEARAAAARRLGNRTRILEAIWEADAPAWLDTLGRDLRAAFRQARQSLGVTLAAVAILGLGIGAGSAMYTVAHAELRPLPFSHPERLVAVLETSQRFPRMGVSYPDYLDWRSHSHAFAGLAALRGSDMALTHLGTPDMVIGARVTANYFSVLGAAPELGRTFTADEDRPGGPAEVVLSDRFWRDRMAADPHALGRQIELDGVARTVIGVMPHGFPGVEPQGRASQFWTPLGAFAGESPALMARGNHPGILVLGRLRDGVPAAAARAELAAESGALAAAYPATNAGVTTAPQSYLDLVAGNTRAPLIALLLAVMVVLLIACANVAGLEVARAAVRQPVAALRVALGATRARLIREHFIEAFGLGLAGCALGLALAWLGLHAAAAVLAANLPRPVPTRPDAAVLATALGAALVTSLLCGLAPALYAARAPVAPLLKEGGAGEPGGTHRLRSSLVVLETALALVLLLGAGFALRTLARLEHIATGLDPGQALTFIVGLPETQYPQPVQQLNFFRQTLARMQALPGVAAAGGIFPLPFGGNDWEEAYTYVGQIAPPAGREPSADVAAVRGDAFHALGISLLSGRGFTPHDNADAPQVAIVDTNLASRGWPGATSPAVAIGRQIEIDGVVRTIVGVVAHVRNGAGADTDAETFLPQDQTTSNTGVMDYVLRASRGNADQLRSGALAALAAVDPDQPVTDMQTMDARLDGALADQRNSLSLLAAFALLALVLAVSGAYGVMAFMVAQRRHEIGLRMALGSPRRQVVGLVLRHSLRLAGWGAAIGLGIALALSRLAAAWLPDVVANAATNAVVTLAVVPLLLLAVTVLAGWWPARHAAHLDPALALRGE